MAKNGTWLVPTLSAVETVEKAARSGMRPLEAIVASTMN